MRTMPMELASSVDVASTERAHRIQRRTSTEATGICTVSMPAETADDDERSVSEEEQEEDESRCWLGGRDGILKGRSPGVLQKGWLDTDSGSKRWRTIRQGG